MPPAFASSRRIFWRVKGLHGPFKEVVVTGRRAYHTKRGGTPYHLVKSDIAHRFDVPWCVCALLLRAGARCCSGPLWRGGWVEESPQDGPHGCGPVFRRDRSPVEKPRNPPAHPEGMARAWMPELRQCRSSCPMPGGRAIGVSFPLGYFYFGQAKEK